MSKTLTWAEANTARPLSATLLYLVAAALRAASELASRRAQALSEVRDEAAMATTVEFHALHREAGAPEGALYVDGVLVGVIEGVKRL
ncbi:hypothetical protein GCM10027034_33220 [Ramlibacter solisilvae]|uniref:Uncharacterized protein n=1 Tax=Ramlibacter tataouinensis TaxID=94132 RepID=A0A127JS87_9BURK|nr:hypothetical protein [Ramlibacter tataouinensis]AMO22841.1 hypothetical protein UC35_07975 [Ramlibacter tataouinensis]